VSSPGERLQWDSEFFGLPVASVAGGRMDEETARRVIEWCSKTGIRLLYFLADDHVPSWTAACAAGFRLVDVRVELALDGNRPRVSRTALASDVTLREARLEDLDDLLPIASTVHSDSRFFADPAVPREKARDLFALWLRRSVDRTIADVVFAAAIDGHPVGYLSAKVEDGAGRIGLVGVDESARGRGVGLCLVQRAMAWFESRGAREVAVVTQGRNVMAQRLYQRCGFLTRSTRLWFHRWF
jgi:dTDP-4-amino-4,6-dideoxy-D-galactose acyltransferase